jgi:G3E family GTPase
MELDPEFLEDAEHEHDEHVSSFVFRSDKPFNGVKLEDFLSGLVQAYGPNMLRYKGVLYMKGNTNRVVFQGVHMLMGGDVGRPWGKGEKRSSTLVFIGRDLPQDLFIKGLEQCLEATQ